MNLRSKAKARAVTPRVAPIGGPNIPAPPTTSDNIHLSRTSLGRLTRPALQKLAKSHQVKANLKNEIIIQQLLNLRQTKRTRPANDEGPASRKRFKREATSERISSSSAQGNDTTPRDDPSARNRSAQPSIRQPHLPEAGPSSALYSATPSHRTEFCYDRRLFSETESEVTEEEQADFATPVSSRSGLPPRAHVEDLKRCVRIMQQISAKDQELLKQIDELQERAARIRKQANEVRILVKVERARRERMEIYFRYWQETEGRWDREWIYEEKVSEDKIKPDEQDGSTRPPTSLPARQDIQGRQTADGEQRAPLVSQPGPLLSPEELKQRREVIVSKQEAEQHELEALQKNQDSG